VSAPQPRTYTRAELAGMSLDELAENANDIVAAGREGRITDQQQPRTGGTPA
jgi:hypothetical protein